MQINEAEAQVIIQQAQQQAQTHFTNFNGRITEFAEHQYRQERQKKEQALKEADDAKKRAKPSDKSEHNTDHKNERSPDNRPQAKQRAGGSPNKLAPIPPFPTGEQASGSQDKSESKHEPKGNPGRPRNTQDPQPKAKAKTSSVRQEAFTKNQTQSTTPTHGTKKDDNKSRSYWGTIKTKTYFVDQLHFTNMGIARNKKWKA